MADTYGMTPEGFIPKRLARIVEDLNGNIGRIADPRTGEFMFTNPSDDSILQQIVAVFAEGLSECWEAAYDASVQFDPLKNSGAGQAGTMQLNGMLLKAGAKSVVEMVLAGKPGTLVPAGSRIASADGAMYAIQADATIGDDRMVRVHAECTEKGAFDPEPNTVVQIQTPVSGWLNAANLETMSVGTNQETEEEARRRQQRSTALTSYRQIDAIYAALKNIPGVVFCRVYQNDRYSPYDSRGIPYKEVAAVVEGGDPKEIADALFYRFPVGVIGYGNTAMIRYDIQGVTYAISFSRPVDVPVWVEIELEVTTRAEFPDAYAQNIRHEILDYARYGGEGNEEGFPPGADIHRSRLYTPINRVGGHRVISVKLGVAEGKCANVDIPIAWNKVGRFAAERITVRVTGSKEDND